MTAGTLLDLRFGILGLEFNRQSARIDAVPGGRGEGRRIARPGDVGLAGPMAGFAPDPDLALPTGVTAVDRVVVLRKVGRVTPRAACISVLVRARPMQAVSIRQVEGRVEVIPTLVDVVPGDVERL